MLGTRLSYLLWLHSKGTLLEELAEQEMKLLLKTLTADQPNRDHFAAKLVPSPITAPVRLRPGDDPLLRLNEEAIKRLNLTGPSAFDPQRPAVAVSLLFLGSLLDLPSLGVIPAAQSGDNFIGWVNLGNAPDLAKHPAVVRVESLRSWAPTGLAGSVGQNSSNGEATAASIVTGRGVRLAVIDLGFDFLHPGLIREADGVEQVRALWLHDMKLPPPPSAPAGALGFRLTSAELQDGLAWYNTSPPPAVRPAAVEMHLKRLQTVIGSADYRALVQQHGTAVAGIAAGNGRDQTSSSVSPVLGGAPEADLLLVAIGAHDETRFADCSEVYAAFQAAFEDATAPCVALMANSDNLGPRDGSLDGELFLDELLLQPGRAVVLTTGNLNHEVSSAHSGPAWHAFAESGADSGPFILHYGSGATWPDSAEVWFRPPEGTNAAATIAIKLGAGPVGPAFAVPESSSPITILDPTQNPNDMTTVTAQLERDDEADAHCLRLVFRPADNEEIVQSEWTINVAAEGPVHAWLDRNNGVIGYWVGPTAQAGAGFTTLGSPASAVRPLAVGSVASATGKPSVFSGCGPLRASLNGPRKPDLVAVGENVPAPLGVPAARRLHIHPTGSAYTIFKKGTSYAAPHVAGACALLFERYGSAATWADIRQAILQATVRASEMPAPEVDGWDHTCGYGLLDVDALLSPPAPAAADLWLPKTPMDTGAEPYVAETFWDSPALVLEDGTGRALDPALVAIGTAVPARLRVRVANRGGEPVTAAVLAVWWAPFGAAHPLPQAERGGGAWRSEGFGVAGQVGNRQNVARLDPGSVTEGVFEWAPPRDTDGSVRPHVLLAAVEAEVDPFDPAHTLCSQNNAAMLSVAAVRSGALAHFQILGSNDTDGLILWHDDRAARLRIERLPVTALPWRDAAVFRKADRSDRPLFGSTGAETDVLLQLSTELEGRDDVNRITDVVGSDRLVVRNGRTSIEGGARLFLPRLRLENNARLEFEVAVRAQAPGAMHVLHLSGGQRVGGGTVHVLS